VSPVDWYQQRSVRDWCLFLIWCLAVGIGVSSRLVSTNIYKSRLVPTKYFHQWGLVSPIGWCQKMFVIVFWCLQIIINRSFVVFSLKGFNANLVFHVLQLIDCIYDHFLMVDECFKK
jgi:hypothetical protein